MSLFYNRNKLGIIFQVKKGVLYDKEEKVLQNCNRKEEFTY